MRPTRLIAATVLLALAAAPRPAGAEARHAALVVDANSGQVLHAQAADEPRFPASLTKMMTLYMAFELVDQGRLSYQSRIKISQEAAAAAPSKLDLDPGEEILLVDAMKALVTKSANDVAIAVAEHIGGSEQNFARLMTAKARQIGMRSTTFRNASGLPDPGQTTTARDMITLALRLQDDFPRHYGLFATRAFTYNGAQHRNHNTLLGSFAGTDGIKTGYTRASGFNLVASVRRDGRHIVAVVFGGSSAASRNAQMRAMLTRALPRATTEKTRKPILVAKPRPAPRPAAVAATRPEARPEVQARAMPAPRPQVVASREAPPRPAPAADRAAAPPVHDEVRAEAQVAAEPPRATIEIARVRRVMVAPRLRPSAPRDGTDGTEEPPAGFRRAADPDRTAAPSADAPIHATETALAKSVARSIGEQQVSDAQAQPAVDRAPALAPAPLPSPAAAPVARQPSTLSAQAAALTSPAPQRLAARTEPAALRRPSYHLQGPGAAGPAGPEASRAGGGFQIQVGAYATAAEAERQLAAVRTRASAELGHRQTLALPVRKGDRELFRARFAGFDAQGAAKACLELRRQGVDCFVMRAE